MFIKCLIAVSAMNLSLMGFSSCLESHSEVYLNKIYTIAREKLREGHWKQAIKKLKYMENHYSFRKYSQRIQLNLIYAYYKNSELILAKKVIDRFIKLNPTHYNIDYVIYMRGLINMKLSNRTLCLFFNIDTYNHDPKYMRAAFNDFSKLVYSHPNSKYFSDAIKRLIFLKNHLAEHEYSIANYYTHRGAWVAVVNRVEGMLRDYPDTRATRNGLHLMKYAYCQMKMLTQADKVEKIISANSDIAN